MFRFPQNHGSIFIKGDSCPAGKFYAAFTLGDIDISDLIAIRQMLPGTPIYGICGNHDTVQTLALAGIPDIHGKSVEICGIRFAGFAGSVRYKRGLYTMFSQKESLTLAKKLPSADVLLTHDRAFACRLPNLLSSYTKNPHEGLVGISVYLRKSSPFLHIHGHIHENTRYCRKGIDTISVYGSAAVTIQLTGTETYQLLQHNCGF